MTRERAFQRIVWLENKIANIDYVKRYKIFRESNLLDIWTVLFAQLRWFHRVATPRLYICGCFDIITGYALPSLRSLRAYRGELTPSRGGMLRSLRDAPHIPPLDLKQPDSATQASLRQNAQVSSPRYAQPIC